MIIQGQVGPPAATQSISPGTTPNLRLGQMADQIITELQGRFYENVYRNACFSGGMGAVTALSAATITLTATTTPIIGVWNPLSSPVNLVILQAALQLVTIGNSAVAPGAFVWAASINNGVITTGLVPYNRKTLAQAGSQAKFYTIATALTGLTNNLAVIEPADFGTLVMAQGATGTPMISPPMVQNFDGALIVPPGGVLALLNTISSTTISVASRLLWAEVPL
jgi:hypothetical protein